MRVKFSAQATVFSASAMSMNGMRQFPADVVKRVIVCNRDGCSYQHITDVKDGKFDVDFVLEPLQQDVRLTDTLKFHFYTGNSIPIVIAAGAITMRSVESLMNKNCIQPATFKCNFAPLHVNVDFIPHGETLAPSARPVMDTSALYKVESALEMMQVATANIANIIKSSLNIQTTCAAPMFCNLITAHNMQDCATSHMHFQSDVEPTQLDSMRFYKTGITMTALAETLHAKCLEADEVLAMDDSSPQFTSFVAGVCQSYMRSAHICPYVSDKVLSPSLDAAGQIKHILSESFKLPLREPFDPRAGFLCADDCEGQATFMLHLFRSFQHLFEANHDHHAVAFPSHMFNMNEQEKLQIWNVAMKIGKLASSNHMRCDILLISAGSASLGDGGNNIGGHATCVLVNNAHTDSPTDYLMEGTNSMVWEDDGSSIVVMKDGLVPINIPMVQVANLLTDNLSSLLEPVDAADCRKMVHINKQLETKFYKTGFCQNGVLLASIGKTPTELNYGVNMDHISDYKLKVLMPVTPALLNKVTQTDNAHDFLQAHFQNRKCEIHPPAVSEQVIGEVLSRWTPVKAHAKNPALANRTYKVCLSMRSIRDPVERAVALANSVPKLAQWNEKYKAVGFCDTYVAFDTLFTRLCMWTDNIPALQAALSTAMSSNPQ